MTYKDHIPKPRFLAGDANVTFHVGATATLRCGVLDLGTKTVSTFTLLFCQWNGSSLPTLWL